MVVKFELKLTNNTAKNWAIWKALESDMTDLCKKYNVSEIKFLYDDVYYMKTVILEYDSDKQFTRLMTEAGILAGKEGLDVEVLSRIVLENESLSMVQDIKKTLELANIN